MTARSRIIALVAAVVVIATSATAYAVREARHQRTPPGASPEAEAPRASTIGSEARIVFRHTGVDSHYGLVAMVALDDPGGARDFTEVACDRVDAGVDGASCLRTQRGVATKFEADTYDADWHELSSAPLPGVPSRTRLSPDGSLVATTSFVSGHEYMQTGFSTETRIRAFDGQDLGNLEEFALSLDGKVTAPADRNIWGVTFVNNNAFYASVGTGEKTYLVKGDRLARTLTSVTQNAECPSVSPDHQRVAFKVDLDPGPAKNWGLAVLDLETGKRTPLTNGPQGVDDQVEWLDDNTLLYGLPRADEPGVTDVWSIATTPKAKPKLLIEQAWSPSVIRG